MNNEKIRSFTDLNAWQEGHKLVLEIYKITKTFPREELFCLVNQLRRAAISITSNLAEGFSRPTYQDKARFYAISQGSLTEMQNQLLIARDIKYINSAEYQKIIDHTVITHKLIHGLIRKSKEIHNS